MDSVGQHRSDYDRVFFGSLFSETGRRRSTSQTCLHKILTVITTVPPPLSAAASPPFSGSETKASSPENDANDENKVALCVPPEAKEYEADAAPVEGGGGSSAVHGGGYCEGNLENDAGVVREDSRMMRVEEEADDGRSLILLIEAAKLIFGDFKDDDKSDCGEEEGSQCSELKKDEAAAAADITEPNGRKLRRRRSCWMAAEMGGGFVETASSAVVRSKRGRTTVLPLKYRDSVLEPLNRLTRPGSSIFPSKRRRR